MIIKYSDSILCPYLVLQFTLVKKARACYNRHRKKRPMTASFRNYVLFFNNRSLRQKLGGYFFCIAKIYPVATINKRIAPISDISAHPLSGERHRRRISPAQGRFRYSILCSANKHKQIFACGRTASTGFFIPNVLSSRHSSAFLP